MAIPKLKKRSTLALLVGCLLVACADQTVPDEIPQDPWGVVTVGAETPIRIAVAVSQESELMNRESAEVIRGIELALIEQDTIRGVSIEYVVFDGSCSSTGGTDVARRIIADTSIVGVIGPLCSSACASAAPILDEAHLTAVSPMCGASELTDQVGHFGSFLRTMYDDSLEGGIAAEYAYQELAARRAVIVNDSGPDSVWMSDAFQVRFEDLGGQILIVETLPAGADDPAAILTGFTAEGANVIYAPLLPDDGLQFLGYLTQIEQSGVPIIGSRHFWSDAFAQSAETLGGTLYAAGPHPISVPFGELNISYVQQYGSPPASALHAYGYDATQLLLAGLVEIAMVDADGKLLIGRQGLREALYATNNHVGTSGDLTCTAWGDCSTAHIAIGRLSQGRWEVVYIP